MRIVHHLYAYTLSSFRLTASVPCFQMEPNPPNTEDQPRVMRTTVVKLNANGHKPHWDLMKLRMDVGGGFRGNALIWKACAELWAGAGRIWSQKQTTKLHAAKLLQTSRWTKLMSALLSLYWTTFLRLNVLWAVEESCS